MFTRNAFSLLQKSSYVAAFVACLLATSAKAQLASGTAARVDQAANEGLKSTGVPSASIAIVQNGQVAYLKAYGDAQLAANGKPALAATPAMQYPVGSISKQFTASAVMFLVQQGKLSLDDPIAKYLPDLTRANEVTLRMVLSHTSGYQDYWPEDYVMTSMLVPATAQRILDTWAKKPLDFDPGTKWQYSNTNYVIAGRIIEQVSGEKLIDFLHKQIFKPLGMDTVLNSDAAHLPAGDPIGYQRYALGPPRPAPNAGEGWMFAAGELAMTPRDLALWNISIMNQSLLQPASYAEMFKPVMLKDGKSSGYGLGFFIRSDGGAVSYEHSGEVSGFVSENIVFPAQKASITVLTNEMASSAAALITKQLAPIVLGSPASSPAETRALAILIGLQAGHIDRSQLTDYCSAYFDPQALADFASSLAPLGDPVSIKQVAEELRGGMTFRIFHAMFKTKTVTITVYEMPDGKLEQYLVLPSA